MAPNGKSVTGCKKAKALESINSCLALVMKSGKCSIGLRQTLRLLRKGGARLIIIANNAPPLRYVDLLLSEPSEGYEDARNNISIRYF
ncbi:unnamed protein product [Schistosoma spindalis]|nr:unnamed protein product [Schistosoma spindale]CAI2734274.1 unnamed protein product [Schistosoma spindale]